MNETIKFWLDYIGGADILYLMLVCLAATQLFKMLLSAFDALTPDRVRPFPYVVGSFAGWTFISFDARGAMVGMVGGMVSSLAFFGAVAFLERDAAPDWQKRIAQRIQLK